MKILFLPLNWGNIVQAGWYDAFREAGVRLEIFDYMTEYEQIRKRVKPVRDKFVKLAKAYQPDVIFMQIQHTTIIDATSLHSVKRAVPNCKIINWTGDVRTVVPQTFLRLANLSDLNLISSTGQLDMFKRSVTKPVKYLQIGYDPKLYYVEEGDRKTFDWDVTFVAHYNARENYPGRAEREQTARLLLANFGEKFCLFGGGWHRRHKSKGSIDQKSLTSLYHSSLCSVSVSHFNDLNHYFSDRLLLCMASGRPVISYRFPKWESYFTDKCDLLIADSIDDIPRLVRWVKENPERANLIGKSGAAKVLAEHTYLSRVQELLDMIKTI